ncbi:DUF5644 domain-containing protein [Sulfurimonas xiamenensis]|jgi:hypothetical protein|uniref:DUF5644 domain-containing protein n=1 Tax=Sulfurimonas xiamenensis TaxID=2590021 RepID=A0AAJ4A3S8_9BACT|nr:DUF5644 domain-containing protein [Sulfurimonas xiamenensis]QFR43376.1 hypothetical protein FJR47_05460 [Sulfurimonas xiamenensis]
MTTEVHVELFRFDAKADYLPYYKKYTLKYKAEDTILDLLNDINSIEKFAYDPVGDFNLKINNLYLNANELISDIVEKTSNEFKIEPVSIYRALNDLIVDKRDYIEKISFFKDYITQSQMDEYAKRYELDYFASNTYDIHRSYIGDHSLLIASDIIEQNPDLKQEILEKISCKETGIWYHTSLKRRVFNYDANKENKIRSLFEMLPKVTDFKMSKNAISDSKIENVKIFQSFEGFNIAEFEGIDEKSCASIIKNSKANYVALSHSKEDLAPYSALADKDFSLKIAGEILLEAKDENADFIVVRDENDLMLFDKEQKRIEKIMNREIELPVISQQQFKMLLEGEKNITTLGFDKHRVKVSFL